MSIRWRLEEKLQNETKPAEIIYDDGEWETCSSLLVKSKISYVLCLVGVNCRYQLTIHNEHGISSLLCAYNTMQWCTGDVWRTGKIPHARGCHEIKQGSIVIILSSSCVLRVLVHTLIRISSVVLIIAWHNVTFILLKNDDKATNKMLSGQWSYIFMGWSVSSMAGYATHPCSMICFLVSQILPKILYTQSFPYLKAGLPCNSLYKTANCETLNREMNAK